MANHWGWYWKVKKNHKPKTVCSAFGLNEIDSFAMYNDYRQIEGVRSSKDKCSLFIPRHNLRAYLQEDDSLFVKYYRGYYSISVEKKPCNFGGYYYFFHCPKCDKRMRKLYCIEGQYMCRKCGNLCYYTQRLEPQRRACHMQNKVEEFVKNRAGNIKEGIKPPRMHYKTFEKLKDKAEYYEAKDGLELYANLRKWYGPKIEEHLDVFEYGWQDTVQEYEQKYAKN